MIKYSLFPTKTIRANLYTINKNGLKANSIKIGGINFRREAHTQQGLRTWILKLTDSKPIHMHLM